MSSTNADAKTIASDASAASFTIKSLDGEARDAALDAVYDALVTAKTTILEANKKDTMAAEISMKDGKLSQSLVKRLDLGKPGKYDEMLQGIKDVRGLENPVGKTTMARKLDHDLTLHRVTCPIGVLLVIFEARPEVIANITALALKSGNAVILKGGKESSNSFAAIAKVITEALANTKIPPSAVQLVQSREAIKDLLDQDEHIDLVIPRGGYDLVRYVKSNTKIPVMGHADGLCAVYIDQHADVRIASEVTVDAKTNYPSACNAAETLVVHENVLSSHLPTIVQALQQAGVSVRCDETSLKALQSSHLPSQNRQMLQTSTEEDYRTEFLDLTIAVKAVPSLEAAIKHINTHSSGHTDTIITTDEKTAETFLNSIDSAGVYWNASTRFADGYRYGFGTEVGISTNKIHARGPVGLEGLMIYKYLVRGNGHTVGMYSGEGAKQFLHKDIEF